MKISKGFLTFLIICVVIISVIILRALSGNRAHVPGSLSRAKGPETAALQILEFTDFQCPACASAAKTFEDILKKYPGQIRVFHKHFPLPMHPNALKASVFAECAAQQNRFWEYHDVLFKSQTSWAGMSDPSPYFSELAQGLGLNIQQLRTCVSDPSVEKTVTRDVDEGKRLGVRGTPTFVTGNSLFVGIKNIQAEIDSKLGSR